MNPARLSAFAQVYAPELLAAVRAWQIRPPTAQLAEVYALDVSMAMLAQLEARGAETIMHYYLNATGGTLVRTCAALGIPCTPAAIDNYLEG